MLDAMSRRNFALWVGFLSFLLVGAPAGAQVPVAPGPAFPAPPPGAAVSPAPGGAASPESAEIAACLCMRREVDALGAEMTARQVAYNSARDEVARLDAQLDAERGRMDVNDPQAVARFRQLLERRDAAFSRSSGAAMTEYAAIVERYNSTVGNYNARCADRPRDAVLLGRVQAGLVCPPR